LKVRVVTYKADDDEALREPGEFSGVPVTESQVLEYASEVTRSAIKNAFAELESEKADKVEVTRVVSAELQDAKYCPICGCKLHGDGERLLCDRHGELRVYVVYPKEEP